MKASAVSPLLWVAFGFLLGFQFSVLYGGYFTCLEPITPVPILEEDKEAVFGSRKDNGWHQVDVFYGESSYLDSHPPRRDQWASQADQDRIVWSLLNKKSRGYFVDLASNDATFLSNSYALETLYNWTGLCIEANPRYWHRLASRPRCKVIGAVVGHVTHELINFTYNAFGMPFSRSDGGLYGGIVGRDFDNRKQDDKDKIVEPRYTVSLTDIFDRYSVPSTIDYLSLDVEGAESYIMGGFPLQNYTIKIMTVERPKPDLMKKLNENGYVLIKNQTRWGEKIFCHESALPLLDFEAAGIDRPQFVKA